MSRLSYTVRFGILLLLYSCFLGAVVSGVGVKQRIEAHRKAQEEAAAIGAAAPPTSESTYQRRGGA